MTISEKVAYLKGLAEGVELEVDDSKEAKLISVMIGILEEVAMSIEDLEENALALGEEIDTISDDLADVEEILFDDDDDCDCHHHHHDDWDEEDFVVDCPECGQLLVLDDDALDHAFVECSGCGSKFSLSLEDSDQDEEDEDE